MCLQQHRMGIQHASGETCYPTQFATGGFHSQAVFAASRHPVKSTAVRRVLTDTVPPVGRARLLPSRLVIVSCCLKAAPRQSRPPESCACTMRPLRRTTSGWMAIDWPCQTEIRMRSSEWVGKPKQAGSCQSSPDFACRACLFGAAHD